MLRLLEAMEIEHTVGQFIMDSISYSIPRAHTHTLVTDMYRLQDLVFGCTSVSCREAGKHSCVLWIFSSGVYTE